MKTNPSDITIMMLYKKLNGEVKSYTFKLMNVSNEHFEGVLLHTGGGYRRFRRDRIMQIAVSNGLGAQNTPTITTMTSSR